MTKLLEKSQSWTVIKAVKTDFTEMEEKNPHYRIEFNSKQENKKKWRFITKQPGGTSG